jgi:oligo-1,6-glucosidase
MTFQLPSPSPRWWKDGVVYQIWPASYKDSNGDGFGDIPGIIPTIPYLKYLGVDIIWLSPMYDSPQHDMGYDISNYEDVWSKFGTMADMDKMIEEVHAHGMKLILDLVVNHTSDEHKWFVESAKGKDNEYSDWYIWRDPKYDDDGKRQPPTNWMSIFGGSAWEYVAARDQYYLHLFAIQQPDLNWEIEFVRRAIYKTAVEFWLDKGIDGFRVDTVNLYSKNIAYPDAPISRPMSKYQPANEHFMNGPRMHEWLKEQRNEVLTKYGDVMLVGELGLASEAEIIAYVHSDNRMLDMIFDFGVVELGGRHTLEAHETYKHKLPELKKAVMKVQNVLRAKDVWVTVFAENHDQGRSLSRFATDSPTFREKAAKLLAMMLSTLSGTLFLYQGQEIGMVNCPSSWGAEELRDISAIQYLKEMEELHPDDTKMQAAALAGLQRVGRDNARTPMQWSAKENAGFTTGKPWIRVHDNYKEVNVAAQLDDADSVLRFWKRMTGLRKEYRDLLIYGQTEVDDMENLETFTYTKTYGEQIAVVVLNFGEGEQDVVVPKGRNETKGK